MKKVEKYIFTIIFLIGVGGFSLLSINNAKYHLRSFFEELNVNSIDDLADAKEELNTIVEDYIYERYSLIEAYGAVNKFLGKKEINGFEYVIDKNGYLSLGNFWNIVYDRDEKALAVNTERFREMLEEKDIPMMFVAFPQKVSDEWTEGYSGIPYDDFEYEMNQFLLYMRRYRIPYVNLSDTLLDSGLEYEELFFKTDHHWTSKGAFLGFVETVNLANDLGVELDPDYYYRNFDNYTVEHFDNMMLGSSGRSAGMIYSGGAEDFDLYYIDNNEKYELQFGSGESAEIMHGSMYDTLLNRNIVQSLEEDFDKNIYVKSMYDMYLRGIRAETSIRNLSYKEGASILILSDSFSMPIATWFAPMCSRVDVLWLNSVSKEQIENYINVNDYDLVILALYPNDMNDQFIHLPYNEKVETEEEKGLGDEASIEEAGEINGETSDEDEKGNE